jgi:hypothetical protein
MDAWELRESWGEPQARENSMRGSRAKETWLYGRSGGTYLDRVYIEDGRVVGWRQRRN